MSQSIGSPLMTPGSFVKSTESYKVSLVNIKRQTSYDSGILRQDYGIRNYTGHHMDSIFSGKDQTGPNNRIGPDCASRAQLQ